MILAVRTEKTRAEGSALKRRRKGGDRVSPGNLHRIYQRHDASPEWGTPKRRINAPCSTFLDSLPAVRGRKACAHVIFHNSMSHSSVFSPTPSARTPPNRHALPRDLSRVKDVQTTHARTRYAQLQRDPRLGAGQSHGARPDSMFLACFILTGSLWRKSSGLNGRFRAEIKTRWCNQPQHAPASTDPSC